LLTEKDVTIIIPSYITSEEAYSWLCEAIESSLMQDCPVIVYDDGSPMRTFVCDELRKLFRDSDISIYGSEINNGVAYARNRAVEKVTTSLFIPLDCDDKFASDAIRKMIAAWKGIPIYPDISKFGLENEEFYRLPDFSCEILRHKLGISSVNVLQSVYQWKVVGGWNENLDLYEDAEYNVRLLGTFCGQNYHMPLVLYRQHSSQRTRKYSKLSVDILHNVSEMVRSYNMPCSSCGGGRRSQAMKAQAYSVPQAGTKPLQSRLQDMPGSQGDAVLAHYIGGAGMGAHYYKGPVTKYPYRVVYDDLLYVDPRDCQEESAMPRTSMFIRIHKDGDLPVDIAGTEQSKIIIEENIVRTPISNSSKIPVRSDVKTVENLPDIANLSVRAIRNLDMTQETAVKLLRIEKDGLNREKVIAILESRI